MTSAGVFLTHQDTPRVRRHFERLVAECGDLVTWHLALSHDAYPRPETSFRYDDPAEVLPVRYRRMAEHGGVQGGYLDTLLVPVLRALDSEHVWLCEYDVDLAGSWSDLFGRFEDDDADLLTTTVMYRHEQPQWNHWQRTGAPAAVPEDRWLRSLNPIVRLSRRALEAYCEAMRDEAWKGHYEFTLVTAVHEAGLVVEDLGGDTSFTPEGRRNAWYVGKSPAGRPADLTFGFRPVRRHYFEERPEAFERPGLLYHPVKPGIRAWNPETMNVRPAPDRPAGPGGPAGGAGG